MQIKDEKYLDIVKDILKCEEFVDIEKIKHHDNNRLEHSLRVSYCSYKVAKKITFKLYRCS